MLTDIQPVARLATIKASNDPRYALTVSTATACIDAEHLGPPLWEGRDSRQNFVEQVVTDALCGTVGLEGEELVTEVKRIARKRGRQTRIDHREWETDENGRAYTTDAQLHDVIAKARCEGPAVVFARAVLAMRDTAAIKSVVNTRSQPDVSDTRSGEQKLQEAKAAVRRTSPGAQTEVLF
jgi:hypothetical protein